MSPLCAVMQPTYLPWIGYFDLIDQADIFVFLDNVQLVRPSWGTRNRIKTNQGELYLSVPIQKTASLEETCFNTAHIFEAKPWRKKHLKSMEQAYAKAPFFKEVFPMVKRCLQAEQSILSELNIFIIQQICHHLGIHREFVKASDIPNIQGRKDALVVSICKALDCRSYLSALGSAVYIERESPGGEFAKNGIDLSYHQYQHPIYHQLYGDFLPYMSIVDLLFNHGFAESLNVLTSGRQPAIDYQIYRNQAVT